MTFFLFDLLLNFLKCVVAALQHEKKTITEWRMTSHEVFRLIYVVYSFSHHGDEANTNWRGTAVVVREETLRKDSLCRVQTACTERSQSDRFPSWLLWRSSHWSRLCFIFSAQRRRNSPVMEPLSQRGPISLRRWDGSINKKALTRTFVSRLHGLLYIVRWLCGSLSLFISLSLQIELCDRGRWYFVFLKKANSKTEGTEETLICLLSGASHMFHVVFSVHLSIIRLTGISNVFVQCLEICGSRAFQVEML